MIYVDTSVIVAAMDPGDERRTRAARKLSQETPKIVSDLTLAELASVISRRGRKIVETLARREKTTTRDALMAVLAYVLNKFKLTHVPLESSVHRTGLGLLSEPYLTAIEMSPSTRLATLDLLHLAYAITLKRNGLPIKTFVTADSGFERAREYMAKQAGIELYLLK